MAPTSFNTRRSFGCQPGQYLLLDLGYPMTNSVLQNVITAVENILAMASAMRGKARIPAFGLGTISSNFNIEFSLNFLKGNFNEIARSMNRISKKENVAEKVSVPEYKNLLCTAMATVSEEFNNASFERNSNTVKKSGNLGQNWPSRLNVTLITKKNASPIINMLLDVAQTIPLVKVAQLDIVEILSANESPSLHKSVDFINCIIVPDSLSALDFIFKAWLFERSGDKEHVSLTLNEDLGISVKCDISECILSPSNLPLGHRFSLYNELPLTASGTKSQISGSGNDVPVFRLQIIQRIPLSGLCPSFLFGRPRRLYATNCWKLNWNELNVNRQLFKGLCSQLSELEFGLLVQYKSEETTTYFFIISDSDKLMLNSVASLELSLPERLELETSGETEEEAISIINHSLNRIPILEEYSSARFSSGLYQHFKNNLKPKPAIKNEFGTLESWFRRKRLKTDQNGEEIVAGLKPGEYVPEFVDESKDETSSKPRELFHMVPKRTPYRKKSVADKKKPKPKNKEVVDVIHPALLPPETKAKYRKNNSDSLILPELNDLTDF